MGFVISLLLAVLSSAPEPLEAQNAALLLVRRNGVSADDGKRLLGVVAAALEAAGGTSLQSPEKTLDVLKNNGVSDTLACGGRTACLLAACEHSTIRRVVLVSVSQVGADRAWVLEVVDRNSGVTLAREEWLDGSGVQRPGSSPGHSLEMARADSALHQAASRLAPLLKIENLLELKPIAQPAIVKLEPPLHSEGPAAFIPAVTAPVAPRILPKVLLGAGIAAGAAAIGLGTAAGLANADANSTSSPSSAYSIHTKAEAQALVARASAFGVAAGIAGALALGLTAGAVFTW
jgi:hypothetical protein